MGKHIIYDSEQENSDIWFEEERINLNKELDCEILVIADLGLWNGRHSGYRIVGANLRDILSVSQGDCYMVYFDSTDGEVKADDIHHDGTNHYIFREIRKGARDCSGLTDKIYNGSYTQEDIDRYTKSLGKYVCKIYGWKKDKAQSKAA